MKVTFNGAAGCVTGSCYHIKTENKEFLVDCGMFQGKEEKNNFNEFNFNPSKINFMFLTHAHIDHSGLIPRLVKEGFRGDIYCTPATAELVKLMLENSANIQENNENNKYLKRLGKPPVPAMYHREDVETTIGLIKPIAYKKTTKKNDISFTLYDAGHILGSAHIEIKLEGKTLVFSGDIGQTGSPIINDPTKLEKADYVFIEATYGNKNHEDKSLKKKMLKEAINETVARGGKIIIPSFALERTQELLYYLYELTKSNEIARINTYLDSPLASNLTKIFKNHKECYDNDANGYSDPLSFKGLIITSSTQESMQINDVREPCIIISSSGMCTAGRILHHLKHNIWDERNTILFVGYQAEDTIGRDIVEGKKEIKIFNAAYAVKAQITKIEGFSGHAGQSELLDWSSNFKTNPEFIVCHSEPLQADTLVHELKKLGFEASAPKLGETKELD